MIIEKEHFNPSNSSEGGLSLEEKKIKEREFFQIAQKKIDERSLPMRVKTVNYQEKEKKATFYFCAKERIDFREFVKDLSMTLGCKIEMYQIGSRTAARMIGGIGRCGRMLCCASFLSKFEFITVKMAKTQGLTVDMEKIIGPCGKLMCCLAFECDGYIDINKKISAAKEENKEITESNEGEKTKE